MVKILILTEVDLPNDFAKQVENYLEGIATVQIRKTDFEGLKSQFRDIKRGQVRADDLLNYLEPRVKGYEGFDKIVLIIDDDGYVKGFNFVFGIANIGGSLALVFTERLRDSEKLYIERILKEVLHELGHTFGLDHCNDPKCVMHFSNTILDTDRKGPAFCPKCMTKLKNLTSHVHG
ncbi:MAG: archaemetzincin family Zn-dependent metalloprotease [Vulcanisaeta sp. AZ3]|jgi:archaemetzincin